MRDYASLYRKLLTDLGYTSVAPDTLMSSDLGVDGACRLALAASFYKKLAPGGNSRAADDAALIDFKAVNSSLPESSFEFAAESEVESLFWDYFVDQYNLLIGHSEDVQNFDLDFIREHMSVGPGAAQKADSRTMVTKLFESSISYCGDDHLIRLYRGALVETGMWADAEMHRFEKFGFSRVRGGKLFFAPKNAEISRTCCTEASLNMLFQKAIGAFYEMRLAHFFGIRLDTEPDHNRELARLGSIDGSFGTTDLRSASNSIGLQLMQKVHRPGFLRAMILMSRCEKAILPDGSEVDLRMVSTMGNGFTFPLQTAIFACAVRAVYDLMGLPLKSEEGSRQYGVFGDDIVVRREAYYFVNRMLTKLGFTVNEGKSFNTGPFRESCGHDYYAGVNIRGVYVRSLETPQQVYSLINRLNRWVAFHGVPLPQTLGEVRTWVRDIRIPPAEPDDAGIKVPFTLCRPKVSNEYWFKYRCFVRRLKRMAVTEPDDPQTINPNGTGIGFLSGVYRRPDFLLSSTRTSGWKQTIREDGELTFAWPVNAVLRDLAGERARYKIVTRLTPWWDFIPDPKMGLEPNGDPAHSGESLFVDEWRIPVTRGSYSAWQGAVAAFLHE